MMPDVFADMMKIAKVMDLSPELRVFIAIQEPFTGSVVISVSWPSG